MPHNDTLSWNGCSGENPHSRIIYDAGARDEVNRRRQNGEESLPIGWIKYKVMYSEAAGLIYISY